MSQAAAARARLVSLINKTKQRLLSVAVLLLVVSCLGEKGEAPPLGALIGSTASPLMRTFSAGLLIVPLDTTSQDSGALRAYGLVYKLLSNNVSVHWAIRSGKAAGGNDFTISAPARVNNLETNAAIAMPISYRGGPFIIDAADRAA